MKATKKSTTGPSTDGSNTTPARQEALIEKAASQKKEKNEASAEQDSDDINDADDEEMHSDDSVSMMRLDSEICLPRGKFYHNSTKDQAIQLNIKPFL